MSNAIGVEVIRKALPKKVQKNFTDEMAARLIGVVSDADERERYLSNVITYAGVLRNNSFKLEEYFAAVRYVGFKMQGETNQMSYLKTFPNRYQRLLNLGKTDSDIAGYVSCYQRTMLVSKILEQGIIPLYVSHQDLAFEALTTLVNTMKDTKSDRVRIDAADRILLHLKIPEVAKVQMDVNVKPDDSISELRQATLALVKQQEEMLLSGQMNAKQIAHSSIVIDGEYREN